MRSVENVLSPAEMAFYRGGKGPSEERCVEPPVAVQSSEQRVQRATQSEASSRGSEISISGVCALPDEPYMQTTFGFPRTVLNALRRAALDRKIDRQELSTQQAIVNELVLRWLEQEGYWPPRSRAAP